MRGFFRQIGGVFANNIARWDGVRWHPLGNGLDREVTCLAVYRGSLFVGESFQFVDGQMSLHLARWDGAAWSPASASTGSYSCCYTMNSLAVYRDELIAGGDFSTDLEPAVRGNSSSRPYISGAVSYIGSLIAGGSFAGPSAEVPLMVWDGTAWSRFPGIRGYATALSVVRGRLFLAGGLQIEGSGEEATAVVWDGESWHPLGSGVNGQIITFHEHDGSLYAGGYFSAAGGKSSFGIARWNGLLPAPRIETVWLSQGRPNPFRAVSDFSFEIKQSGRVQVAVHDARGHEVAVIESGVRPAGTYDARWDGRDRGGKRVSTGIYFISVRQADGASVPERSFFFSRTSK